MFGSLDGKGVGGRIGMCIYMAESLHCSPETITTLLIGYTSVQNKKFRKRQIPYDVTCMWNLKHDANELIYKTEPKSQTWKTDLWLPSGREEGMGGTESLGLVDANQYI